MEDFPTFDLPTKAYSGITGSGHWLISGLLFINRAMTGFPNFLLSLISGNMPVYFKIMNITDSNDDPRFLHIPESPV